MDITLETADLQQKWAKHDKIAKLQVSYNMSITHCHDTKDCQGFRGVAGDTTSINNVSKTYHAYAQQSYNEARILAALLKK
jgi:hypothetical protein